MTPREKTSSSSLPSDSQGVLAAILALRDQWREMAASALAEGGIPGDDGHSARWHAIDICADDLDALLPDLRAQLEPCMTETVVLNSVAMLVEHCRRRDEETGHDQEWNWLHGHAATIANYFESKESAEYPNQADAASYEASGVITPSTPDLRAALSPPRTRELLWRLRQLPRHERVVRNDERRPWADKLELVSCVDAADLDAVCNELRTLSDEPVAAGAALAVAPPLEERENTDHDKAEP